MASARRPKPSLVMTALVKSVFTVPLTDNPNVRAVPAVAAEGEAAADWDAEDDEDADDCESDGVVTATSADFGDPQAAATSAIATRSPTRQRKRTTAASHPSSLVPPTFGPVGSLSIGLS